MNFIILLEEELEMEELQLYLHGVHEADHEKYGETFTVS